MITPMLRPDVFGALATHAGDALYEYCYLPEFADAVRYLREYDGDIWRWWDDFRSRPAMSKKEDPALITALGCSAAFSPGDDGRPVLPVDPVSGVVRPEVWARWLAWDPVRMVRDVPEYAAAMRSMRAVWVDSGTKDDYYLDLGAQAFTDALREAGVPDETGPLRALRGDPRRHRLPLPHVAALAGRAPRPLTVRRRPRLPAGRGAAHPGAGRARWWRRSRPPR